MERLLDDVVGGRDPRKIRWLGLSHQMCKSDDGERINEVKGLEDLTNLVSLDLSGHAIADLEELRHARVLEELDLSRNRVKRLEGVGRLRNLRVLNISWNAIEHLPKQIGLLSELRWLDISNNRLSVVSELTHLGGCSNLFRLMIKNNPVAGVSKIKETVLKACPNLISLDGLDVSVRDKNSENIRVILGGGGEMEMSDKSKTKAHLNDFEHQLEVEGLKYQKLVDENNELRSELEATSQLLARKTSEWAIAEEQASRLQQELAFMRIDRPPAAPPAGRTEEKPLYRQNLEERPEQESFSSSSALLKVAKQDTIPALKTIDAEIRLNTKRTEEKLKSLAGDYKQAKLLVETLQAQLDVAMSAHSRTKQDMEAAERTMKYEEESYSRSASAKKYKTPVKKKDKKAPMVRRPNPLIQEKRKEMSELSALLGKLRSLRATLKTKMELAQDLLVVRTENMVSEDLHEESENIENRKRRLDQLETDFERACVETVATSSDISFTVSSNNRMRELMPELSLIHIQGDEIQVEDGGKVSSYSMFDASVTALSEHVMRCKEQDSNVKDCLDTCLTRLSQVESSIESLERANNTSHQMEQDEFGEPDDDDEFTPSNYRRSSDSDFIPEHQLRAELLSSSIEREAETITNLNDELKAGHIKLREIQIAMLRTRSDSWKTEASLRAKQCSIMLRAIEMKDATLEACNRTIARLEQGSSSSTLLQEETIGLLDIEDKSRADEMPLLQQQQQQQREASTSYFSAATPAQQTATAGTTTTTNELNDAEQKARACRRQVYDELLISEKKYVEKLTMLHDVFIVPMRRRCVLPPRDLQVICNNYEQILRLHDAMFDPVSNRRDAMSILSAFDRFLDNTSIYVTYFANCAVSLAMVLTRQHEVGPFASFLEKTNGVEATLIDLMLVPLRRLVQYDRCFARLVSLNTSSGSVSVRNKLAAIVSAFGDLLEHIDIDETSMMNRAQTLSSFLTMVPVHASLGKKQTEWIMKARISNCERRLLEKLQTLETMIMNPRKKAVSFMKCYCFIYTDCLVLAAYPLKWRPTFSEEHPKLRACGVYRARDGLCCTRPFSSEDRQTTGVRVTCQEWGVRNEEEQIEIILQFASHEQASKVFHAIESKVKPLGKSVRAHPAPTLSPGGATKTSQSSVTSDQQSSLSQVQQDDLGYTPKYPGTDMKKRREIARRKQQERGSWAPPELENVNTMLAKEKIKKREGISYNEHSDELKLREYDPIPVTTQEKSLPHTPVRPMSPIKSRSVGKPRGEPLGFGSSSAIERNKTLKFQHVPSPKNARRTPTPSKQISSSLMSSSLYDEDILLEVDNFDVDSPYYRPMEVPSQPNLSIFKTPKKHGPSHSNGELGFQSKRLIGLEWSPSEFVKESNRAEEKYYSKLGSK